jgi:hypothetical protein
MPYFIQERSKELLPDQVWETTLGVTSEGEVQPLQYDTFTDACDAARFALWDCADKSVEYRVVDERGIALAHMVYQPEQVVDLLHPPEHIAELRQAVRMMKNAASITARGIAERNLAMLVWRYRKELFGLWGV